MGLIEKALAVGHDHGVEPDRLRVSDDPTELLDRQEGDLARGDLHFAAVSEVTAEGVELRLHFRKSQRLGPVRQLAQVAARAGEVAPLHHRVGSPAAHGRHPRDLLGTPQLFGQLPPLLLDPRARLVDAGARSQEQPGRHVPILGRLAHGGCEADDRRGSNRGVAPMTHRSNVKGHGWLHPSSETEAPREPQLRRLRSGA